MSILIKDTTREEREEIVKNGISLSTLDALPPTENGMALFNKYIEGEIELADVTKRLISFYKQENE